MSEPPGMTAPMREFAAALRQKIAHDGWVVLVVFDPDGGPYFLYTNGLTVAGLPELMMLGVPRNAVEAMHVVLDTLARQSLAADLVSGAVYDCGLGLRAKITAGPIDEDHIPGWTFNLYGRDAVRVLYVTPGGVLMSE